MIVARPQIEKFLSLGESEIEQSVIIIDNSFYTSHLQSGGSQLDEIKDKAKEIVNSLSNGSHVSVISNDDSSSEFTEIKAYALDKIDQVSPSPRLVDMKGMLSSANDILKDTSLKGKKKIYVISDMNVGSWQGNYQLKGIAKESVHLIHVSQRRGNIFINNVAVKSEGATGSHRVYANRNIQILSQIQGDRSLAGVKAVLKINDETVDEKNLTDDHGGKVTFTTSFEESGTYFCEIFLDSKDGIEEDNHFFFTINVRPPAKIFILNDTQDKTPLYYKAALAPSGWHGRQKFNVMIMNYTELNHQLAQNTPKLIILSGSMALTENTWDRLKSFVEQGGSVLICPDKGTGFKELNQGALGLLQAKVTIIEGNLKPMRSSQSDLARKMDIDTFNNVQITSAASFEEEPSGASIDIPFRYSNTNPCLMIRKIGLGEIVFWGLSPDPEASTFLQSDSFALIWHKIAERFSSENDFQQNFICGDSVEIKALKSEISNYKVKSPTGSVDKLPSDVFNLSNEGKLSTTYSETLLPGHYRCSSVFFGGFSCNIDRQSQFYQYPQTEDFKHLIPEEESVTETSAPSKVFGPNGLLITLILATLALMVFEVHLGNRNFYAGN